MSCLWNAGQVYNRTRCSTHIVQQTPLYSRMLAHAYYNICMRVCVYIKNNECNILPTTVSIHNKKKLFFLLVSAHRNKKRHKQQADDLPRQPATILCKTN